MIQKQQLQQQLQQQQLQMQAQAQQQMQAQQLQMQAHAQKQAQEMAQQQAQAAQAQQQQQPEELIEENIYDFGGVHVKSCATIALKKSIERGMLPPNAMMRSPVYDSNSNPSSGPSSLESRPSVQASFKQPCPGIASRMMIFQQGSPPAKPMQPQNLSPIQKSFPNPNFFNPQAQAEAMMPPKELTQVRNELSISNFFLFVYSVNFFNLRNYIFSLCVYFQ